MGNALAVEKQREWPGIGWDICRNNPFPLRMASCGFVWTIHLWAIHSIPFYSDVWVSEPALKLRKAPTLPVRPQILHPKPYTLNPEPLPAWNPRKAPHSLLVHKPSTLNA